MNPSFVVGREYVRRKIHDHWGGGRQSGISPSRRYRAIFLFTSKSGEQYGYNDTRDADGVFWYAGEGRVGDMKLTRGNLAIVRSRVEGRRLYLFEQCSRGRAMFLGEVQYLRHRERLGPDQRGRERRVIEFALTEAAEPNCWFEITDRTDLGANLNAPQTDEAGQGFWSYSLIREIKPGDVVIHYDTTASAIVGYSRAVGTVWEDAVTWAARGTSARRAGTQPHVRKGWYLGLEGFTPVAPIALAEIQGCAQEIRDIRGRLQAQTSDPLFFPFAIYRKRALSAQQGYLTRFPRELIQLFPALANALSNADTLRHVGSTYRPANEFTAVAKRDPFSIDPAILERGNRGHAITQNALADWVKGRGLSPRSSRGEPNFDLAWEEGGDVYVAEIKSLTKANEEKQLRLGLGQVLRYRQILAAAGHTVRAVLAVERAPSDPAWVDLCNASNVRLVWKGNFESLNT